MTAMVMDPSHLQPLKRISPSRFTALRNCALKEIWAANRVPGLLPASPAAKLGIVCHKLFEIATNRPLQTEDELLTAWNEICSEVENGMRANPLESHLVPLAKHAGNYGVKQRMAFSFARSISQNSKPAAAPSRAGSKTEQWFESVDGKVGGQIDIIHSTGQGVEISDYKSGAIVEKEGGSEQPKEEYQVQLRLYAGLYYSVKNEWPAKLNVIGLDQRHYDVPFDSQECKQLLEDAASLRDEINSRIKRRDPPDSFANPSAKTCFYCAYRPACKSYWDAREDTDDWPVDISGAVIQKKVLGNGLIRVVIESKGKHLAVRGLSPERHLVLNEDRKNLMLCNLAHDTAKDYFIQTALTAGYKTE